MNLKSIVSLIATAIFSFSNTSIVAKTSPFPKVEASKIEFQDNELAHKVAISFHHAILEVNYKEGYLIAELSDSEKRDLKTYGLKISNAAEWQKRYLKFQEKFSPKKFAKSSSDSLMKGIEGFECYPTVEETFTQAEALQAQYTNLTEWNDIGDSWNKVNGQGGYDLMVLKITNKSISGDKPILFIHSSMHAREYTPAALTIDFATELLEGYQTDADKRWIVDNHEVHILFHMNPDGRKIAERQILQRKNTNQNHCPAGSVGVDLNRNFAFKWNTVAGGSSGAACDETYRGPSAESEPETQAVSNYIRSLYADVRGPNDDDAAPNDTPGMHLDIHSYSQLVLWPWGHTTTASPNNQGFVELGNKLAWFNNYAPMQSVGLYATDGTSDDVSYGELGIAALTFELGTNFFQDCGTYNASVRPDNIQALLYAAKVVAAPYLLSQGPEIGTLTMNGSQTGVSVTQGTPIDLAITASALRTKLAATGRGVSKVEYSIDTPVWENGAALAMTGNDGDVSSGVETLTAQIDTSSLSEGEHIVYARAYNSDNQAGVTTAAFITIGQNNSPTPDFSVSCVDLACSFDASTSNDSDGTIEMYSWDFNGEGNASGESNDYTFATAGDKSVTLTITDNSGNQAEKNTIVTVSNPPPPPVEPPQQSSGGGGSLGWLLVIWFSLLSRFYSKLNLVKAEE